MEEKKNNGSNPFMVPFKLLSNHKVYWCWVIFTIFFGNLNLVFLFCQKDKSKVISYFLDGNIYIFLISICASFAPILGLKFYSDKVNKVQSKFVGYKVGCILIDIIIIIILSLFWVSYLNNIWIQLISGILSIIFILYMFCLSEMENHYYMFKNNDDKCYVEKENENMNKTSKSAKKLSTTDILNFGEE